ncbi:MAG: cation:dicarboxylase symporter family transporter [Crocosphaera sp.]|nr:cation:dicarboxylase symporter family transporter [Crocosphaera sp.]
MQKVIQHIKRNLSTQILISMVLGVATGLFFGEMIGWISIIGDAFIRLFQMPVIPYIMVSLIGSLGKLSFQDAKNILIKGGTFLVIFWLIILAVVIIFPLGFPDWKSASFFSTTLLETGEGMDVLGLFIPFNPFHSMANSVLPSVVVFSITLGLALISIPNKKATLEVLDTLEKTLMRITGLVAKLTPIGVFAILASAAGTLPLEAFGRLQVYIVLQASLSLLLSFWLLPGLIATLTPIKYKDILIAYRTPLITAFATANLLIVLPLIIQRSKELLGNLIEDSIDQKSKMTEPVEVLVPASFTFPDMGRLISLSFIPFAAWFGGSTLSFNQYPVFLISGLASFFGGDGVTIMKFLLTLMRLPTDMLQLYITLDQISVARFGTLLAGMNAVALALLGTAAINGWIRVFKRKILRFSLITVLLIFLIVGTVYGVFTFGVTNNYTKDQVLASLPLLRVKNPQSLKIYTKTNEVPLLTHDSNQSRLSEINKRGFIRACYYPDDYPMSYINRKQELVGFDIEMAHLFAKELGLKLELAPLHIRQVQLEEIVKPFNQGYCDIIAGVVPITPEQADKINFSIPILKYTLGFLVPDYRQEEFKSWQRLQKLPSLRLGIPGHIPYYDAKIKGLIPKAKLVDIDSLQDLLDSKLKGLDAIIVPAESGSAWTLLYPNYSVAIPKPIIAIPMAYALPYNDQSFLKVFNTWLQLKADDGTITSLYNYWIQGKVEAVQPPRWSILRDVLGVGKSDT